MRDGLSVQFDGISTGELSLQQAELYNAGNDVIEDVAVSVEFPSARQVFIGSA